MSGWGKAWFVLAAMAAVAALGGLAPGAMAAKLPRVVLPGSFSLTAELPNSRGYSVSISSDDHRHIELKAAIGLQLINYSVIGRATSKGLDADFGRFGHVSLRFHATQRKVDSSPQLCPGRPTVHVVGMMRGSVRFAGAGGLPTVSTTRVRAEATHSFRQVCDFGDFGGDESNPPGTTKPHPHPHEHGARLLQRLAQAELAAEEPEPGVEGLVAERQTNTGQLRFTAFTAAGLLAIAIASAQETVGRVQIARNTVAIAGPQVLKLSQPGASPQTARFKGPKPFAGRAEYVKAPGEQRWSGSLRAPIVGRGTVSLTGSEFHVKTCRAQATKKIEACAKLVSP
jgi:hypothetical protein